MRQALINDICNHLGAMNLYSEDPEENWTVFQNVNQTPAATILGHLSRKHLMKISKINSFKSSRNIQKNEGGPDKSVSNSQFSSVTLNELELMARKKHKVISSIKAVKPMPDINPNETKNCLEYMRPRLV